MNERIRELVKQAGGHYNSGNQHSWPQYTIDDPKKFAELIVKECIETVAKNVYSGFTPSDFSDGADFAYAQAISDIKEHFGVEE
jgi:hypothetical protein